MYKKLRKKAEQRVQAKMAFYICVIVFSFVTVVLLMLSLYLPSIRFWLSLPIPIFLMILTILYFVAFGLPSRNGLSEDWQEEQIEKEMIKLYRQRRAELPPLEEMSEDDVVGLLAEKLGSLGG